jgi:hypothetical protein
MPTRESLASWISPLALTFVLLGASAASACPFCNGGPAGVNQVKAGIFNDEFWLRATIVLAPFPILLGLVALIYFWPQRWLRS